MLVEARRSPSEIGDVEIEAEAWQWRIAALIVLGELDAARRELADRAARGAARTAQPFILHVAEHYALGDRAGRRPAGRGRGGGGALARVEPAADRARRLRRLRHPDVRRAPRAGPAGRARAGRPGAGRAATAAAAPGGRRWRRCSPSWACTTRRGAELELRAQRRPRRGSARSLWLASLSYLADACAAVGDAATAETVYAELAPPAGRNVMIGHGVACYGAADRYLGMLAATLGGLRRWPSAPRAGARR